MKKLAVLLVLMMTVLGVNRAAAWNFWTCDGFDKSSLSLFNDTENVWSDLSKSVSGTGPVVWKFTLKPTSTTLPWKWHYQNNTWRAQGLTIDCSDDKLNTWVDLNDEKNDGQNQFTNLTVDTEYVITMQAKSEAENWIMKVKVEKATFTSGDLTYTFYADLSNPQTNAWANGTDVKTGWKNTPHMHHSGFGIPAGAVAMTQVGESNIWKGTVSGASKMGGITFGYSDNINANIQNSKSYCLPDPQDKHLYSLKLNGSDWFYSLEDKGEYNPVDPNRYVVRICGENMNIFPGGFDDNGVGTNNIMTTTDGINYTYTVDVTSGTHANQYGFGLRVHDNTVDGSNMWLSSDAPEFKPGTPVTVKTGIAHTIAFAPTFTENTRLLFTYTRTGGADDLTGTLKVECTSLANTPVVYSPCANYDGFNFDNVTISVVGSDNQTRTYAVDGSAKTSLTAADIKSATLSGVVLPEQFADCADNFDWTLDVTESNGALNFALAAQQARQAYFAFHDGSGFGAPASVKVQPVHGQEFAAVACTKPAPRSAARRAAAADTDGNYWYAVATNKSIQAPVAEGENAVADTKVAITFEQATVTFVPNDAAKNNGFAEQTATLPAALPANQVVAEVTQSAAHEWVLWHCGATNKWDIAKPVKYVSTDGVFYIDAIYKGYAGYKFSTAKLADGATMSWDIFNTGVIGFTPNNQTYNLPTDQTLAYSTGENAQGNINVTVNGTLEIDLLNRTMTMHNGFYRRPAYKAILATVEQNPGTAFGRVLHAEVNPMELCQVYGDFNTANPLKFTDKYPNYKIQCYGMKEYNNGNGSANGNVIFDSPLTKTTVIGRAYDFATTYGYLFHVVYNDGTKVDQKIGNKPHLANVYYPLDMQRPGSKSQFASAAVLAAQPVTLNGSVEMPAGIPGHNGTVSIDKANQYTYTFKPGMALADATNVSYVYTVNGVEVQPVSTGADGSVTIGMLPFDASARSSAPLLLGITATYTLAGNEYTGTTEYHAIPRAPMSANAISMTPGQAKIYSTGGFYNASYYNVYTLAQPYTFEATNHAYFVGGVKVSTGDDFYTSTPPNWFDDFVYGTMGRNFDRTPRLYPETWATDMWQGSEIEVVFPHIMHVVKGSTADVKHGAANVEFVAYYPVVYNPALLGGSSSAARAAGNNQTVATLKQTYVAAGNPITAATYASDNVMTGIANIDTDDNGAAEYYNLQGVRVANPTPGIYLMRQGGKVSKVVLQ